MLTLCQTLMHSPELKKMSALIAAGDTPVAMSGLSHAHKAHLCGALRRLTGRTVVVLCADEEEIPQLSADLSAWSGETVLSLPLRELSFYPADTVSREWEQMRLFTLHALSRGQAPIVVSTIDAFLQRTLSPQSLGSRCLTLTPGQSLPLDVLTQTLLAGGYIRSEQVEGVGQFAVRGGIVDFYAPGEPAPVRVEYFGDEIDTLSSVDPLLQRRVAPAPKATVFPVAEVMPQAAPGGLDALIAGIDRLIDKQQRGKTPHAALLSTLRADRELLHNTGFLTAADRYLPLITPDFATAFSYLPTDAILCFAEQGRLSERLDAYTFRMREDIEILLEKGIVAPAMTAFALDQDDLWRQARRFACLYLDAIGPSRFPIPPRGLFSLPCKQLPSYGGHMETAMEDIAHYLNNQYTVVVLCPNQRQAARLQELLFARSLPATLDYALAQPLTPGSVTISLGALSAGMEYPEHKLVILSEGQLVAAQVKPKKRHKHDPRGRLVSYSDLTPGDFVVHEHHGIGRFTGIVKMMVDKTPRDYIHIAYAGSDGLYVPVTQLHLVSKYIGAGEDAGVKLNKLGGAEWQRAKTRAKAAAKELAQGLIALYAERARKVGFAFPSDDDWQKGFEDAFEYVETEDQLRCVQEIKKDMESTHPMDRLLCGDVGFGKTEVALRAVMKCILGGKQAALLVPTTVLAMQHYETAVRRFAGYPVRVGVLSRFVPASAQKETLRRLKLGELDLVIGTHKLLQKNVMFAGLGLLIVDEEQRFGVTHKERLKEMSRQVDVLTLTATPIPRTLNMALSGIRDMSTLEEAPRDRHPVQTFVLEHEPSILLDAIRREAARGGQSYYLHNRVESISSVAAKLKAQLPHLTVEVIHGQLDEERVSDIMRRMVEGRIHVLVCTTIIETGIDIANVNTLIIEDADRMGLAQLHQIRGRVGRSARRAFAYLTYRPGKILSETASKRLTAIREFVEFGAGFKIAMRDLEIRGAGNVLGPEQHGHMMSVGYDMYLKLLEEAVLEERGEPAPVVADCTADLGVAARLPESYVPSPGQRMDLYRRIAAVQDEEAYTDMVDELIDRYGEPPDCVMALLRIALLRAAASQCFIQEISQKENRLVFVFAQPDVQRVVQLCGLPAYKGRLLFGAGEPPHMSLRLDPKQDVLTQARMFVADYGSMGESAAAPPETP